MEERTEYQLKMLSLIMNGSPRAPRRKRIPSDPSITQIPAWAVGDHVRHRSNGIRGILVEMMTQAGELWKMRPHRSRGLLVVHARDLVAESA